MHRHIPSSLLLPHDGGQRHSLISLSLFFPPHHFAKKLNAFIHLSQAKKYERSAFGGVDVWLVLGLMVFFVPFGGLAVGYATGYIHTM